MKIYYLSLSNSYTSLHFTVHKIMEKFSQLLGEIYYKRKAKDSTYTQTNLAAEVGIGKEMIKKYISGDYDQARGIEHKIRKAKEILSHIEKNADIYLADDVTMLKKIEDLNAKVEQLEITINDLQKSLNKILTKLL